jgi:hypothetical protein
VPFEFRSGVRKTTWRFWIGYDFGACVSRIDTKWDRPAKERTCRERVLFQLLSLLTEHCSDCAGAMNRPELDDADDECWFLNRMHAVHHWRRSDPPLCCRQHSCAGSKARWLVHIQPAEKQHRQRTIGTSYLLEIAAARGLPSKLRARPEACGTISDCRKCLTSSKKEL